MILYHLYTLPFYLLKATGSHGSEGAHGAEHAADHGSAAHGAHEAAGHAAGGHHGSEAFDLMAYISHSNIINIIIFVAIVVWALKKFKVGTMLENSRQKIADDIAALEQERKDAEKRLEDIKNRTANLEKEVEDIVKQAKTSAEELGESIIDASKQEAERLIDNAKKRMELEQQSAVSKLEAQLLKDIVADAQEDLAKNLTKKDKTRSVEAFLDELPATVSGKKGS